MVPADDQAMVFPCASVMVIMVLLKVAFTCATPDAIFLRSRLRTRVASLPILDSFHGPPPMRRSPSPGLGPTRDRYLVALAGDGRLARLTTAYAPERLLPLAGDRLCRALSGAV